MTHWAMMDGAAASIGLMIMKHVATMMHWAWTWVTWHGVMRRLMMAMVVNWVLMWAMRAMMVVVGMMTTHSAHGGRGGWFWSPGCDAVARPATGGDDQRTRRETVRDKIVDSNVSSCDIVDHVSNCVVMLLLIMCQNAF